MLLQSWGILPSQNIKQTPSRFILAIKDTLSFFGPLTLDVPSCMFSHFLIGIMLFYSRSYTSFHALVPTVWLCFTASAKQNVAYMVPSSGHVDGDQEYLIRGKSPIGQINSV